MKSPPLHIVGGGANRLPRLRKSFSRSIKRASGYKKIIFSSEAFSGLPDDGFQNSDVVASMLREATKDHNVKIIIYLRRQDDFVESMYTQKIHEGESITFDRFMAGFDTQKSLFYRRIINDLSYNFGEENIIVRSYLSASKKGIIEDFSGIVGIPLNLHVEQYRKNPSYSKHALEIANISNIKLEKTKK